MPLCVASKIKSPLKALLSGILLGLAHSPHPALNTLLTPVFLVALLQSLPGQTKTESTLLGLTSGFIGTLIALQWIAPTSSAGWVIASLLLGSQYAIWTLGISTLRCYTSPIKIASLWVVLETLKMPFPPAGLLPLAACPQFPPLYQIVAVGGEESLSFLIILTNALFSQWKVIPPPNKALVCLFISAWLLPNKTPNPRKPAPQKPLLIYSIPSNTKNPRHLEERITWKKTLLELSFRAPPCDLILWSEGTPFAFPNNQKFNQEVQTLIESRPSALILTGDHHTPKGEKFNSSFLLSSQPPYLQEHKKTVLTALEAYPHWWTTLPQYNYKEGPPPKPLKYRNTTLGILICAEEVSPLHARNLRKQGAEVLLSINSHTPIGVWGTHQAYRSARLRALETQAPLLRCTNQGISSLTLPSGKSTWKTHEQTPSLLEVTPAAPPKPWENPASYFSPWVPLGLSLLFLILPPTYPKSATAPRKTHALFVDIPSTNPLKKR